MRIPRFYLAADFQPGRVIELTKDQAHYALTVLRLKNGHQIEVFDGQGQQAQAILHTLSRRDAQVVLGNAITQPLSESKFNSLLVQGISRGERMDYSLQKAVELGVTAIQPVFTERCEVRLEPDKAEKRQQQWQALVISACEQSGRCAVPPVLPLIHLTDWFGQQSLSNPQPQGLVLDPYADQSLSQLNPPDNHHPYALLIGPEGGLTEQEVSQAQTIGLQAARLGPRILRTETVAPVILSLLQAQWGDLS